MPDLRETFALVDLCLGLGVKILNLSAGSPYYNPHLQRPALYPPSDGYGAPNDPLIDVARQLDTVRQVKHYLLTQAGPASLPAGPGSASPGPPSANPPRLLIAGCAYSYLQEYLPQVAQAVIRDGWTDVVGIGRSVLSYPAMLADALDKGELDRKLICRTFSDCTTAPRHGLISGCYPLDHFYTAEEEFQRLRAIKKAAGQSSPSGE